MKYILDRGRVTALACAALVVGFASCSGIDSAQKAQGDSAKETRVEEFASTSAAGQRLLDLRDRFLILPALPEEPDVSAVERKLDPRALDPKIQQQALPPGAQLQDDFEGEPIPVFTPGEAQRFDTDGRRARAVVSQEAKKQRLRPASVEVPLVADEPVSLRDERSDLAIEFVSEGIAKTKLEVSDGVALYPGAAPGGGDVVMRVTAEGVEDFVVFEQAPPHEEIVYRVDVSRVPGLRFLGEYLEFLDTSGDPRLRIAPPYLVDSDGTRHQAAMSVEGCAYDRNWKAPWGRPVTSPGAGTCTVRVSWGGDIVYPAVLDPAWTTTGSLAIPRTRSASAAMNDDRVLVCGGQTTGSSAPIASCEIWDPAGGSNGSFSATESMNVPRHGFELLTGADGRVLAVGAGAATGGACPCGPGFYCFTPPATDVCTAQYTSELYDPTIDPDGSDATVNAWAISTGNADSPSGFPSIDAGFVLTGDKSYVIKLDYSGVPQRYEFATNSWIADGPAPPAPDSAGVGSWPYRSGPKIVPDPGTPGVTSGVMRIGGYDSTSIGYTDIYDVADGWYDTANPVQNDLETGTIDYFGWAVLESQSKVLLYGGYNYDLGWLTRAELYDAAAQDWTTFVQELPYPNFGLYNDYYLPGAYHAGSDRYLLSVFGGTQSTYMVYNPSNLTTPFSIGYTNFNSLSNVWPHFVGAGTTVLAAPVTVSGSGPKVEARIFEFLDVADTCNQNAECLTGFCRDGVCCSTQCAGDCMACSAGAKQSGLDSGTCGPRYQGYYVGYLDDCPSESQDTCGNTGYCDGLGGCQLWADGTVCDQGTCVDDFSQNDTLFCNGLGACDPPNISQCSDISQGHKCVSGACKTSCNNDTDCIAGYYCDQWNGNPWLCKPKNADGNACPGGSATECENGNCVDNVCCSTACTATCMSCNDALTGQGNGNCAEITANTDPNNDCGEQFLSPCNLDGSCAPQICDDGDTLQILKSCNGSGACTAGSFPDCTLGYSCTNNDCNDACSSDAECIPSYHCTNLGSPGTCIPDLVQGNACSRNEECPNNQNCVDNVCCNSSCTGTCQACSAALKMQGSDGTCGPVLAGEDPINECAQDAAYPQSCLSDGNCNGSGACRTFAPANVECEPTECNLAEQTEWTCTGTGPTCKFKITNCYPYECGGSGTCRTTCSDDTQCSGSDSFCDAPNCVGQQPNGTACTSDAQCASTHCSNIGIDVDVDGVTVVTGDYPGVCCDLDCDSKTCQACKAGLKGFGAEGECLPVNTGLDPRDECAQDDLNICGFDGTCNGTGLCAKAPLGTACGNTTCVGNSVQGQICDGTGYCIDSTSTTACAPYVCGDVDGVEKCTNPCADDDDCASGFRCNAGTCVKKLGNGKPCTDSFVCESNYCVDGVCCDTGCNGQCEACDSGSPGVCSPIEGVPHGDRPECDQAGEECGGECDGVNSAACKYAPSGTACGEAACDAGIATSAECNGQGTCDPNPEIECAPYVCDADATCKTRCDVDEDCSQGYACDETAQRCLPQAVAAECSEDRLKSVGNNGETACKPFLCDVATGACAVLCATTNDCAPDFVCDAATKVCLPKVAASSVEDDSGCGCRTVGTAPARSGNLAWLAALGLVVVSAGRRRTKKAA